MESAWISFSSCIVVNSSQEKVVNIGKLSLFLFIDVCSFSMLPVSVETCTATGAHIYSRTTRGPRSALHTAHFPKMKLKPTWKSQRFSFWKRVSDEDITSIRVDAELTDGEWIGRGCRREARSEKIQDKACNQMSQHDQSRSKLQNKSVWGLCQSSKRLWLQMASLNSPNHLSIAFMACN